MDALVEVHNEAEAETAVRAGASLFGINNRDLHTFDVDLATTERIRPLLPRDAVVVGESGVHTKDDVQRLYTAGVNAILVGEAFMTAPDALAKMRELRL
jgi:indole-3-glycerol phosphate synthase